MNILKTTTKHAKYWFSRKIDWKQHYFTPEHPHRQRIVEALKRLKTGSLLEVGCAAGANLYKIHQDLPYIDLGGVDINQEAVAVAKELNPFAAAKIYTGMPYKLFFSDKSLDTVLTDMCLIYVGKDKIKQSINEIKRVARKSVIFVEFHHTNALKRLHLKATRGYNAYDYRQLLENNGFYDILITKLTPEDWPGGQPQSTFGYIITARL